MTGVQTCALPISKRQDADFAPVKNRQCNSSHGARPRRRASGVLILLLAWVVADPLARAGVTITVTGVSDQIRGNVLAYLSFARYQRSKHLTSDTVDRLASRVPREVQAALRPFGYYQPKVSSSIKPSGADNWRVAIKIDPGQPVILKSVDVHVVGQIGRAHV